MARINFTPAFRYFAASASLRPQNAAIGASPIPSLPRKNFSNYAVVKLLVFCFFIIIAQSAIAQNKNETPKKIAIATKAKYSLTNNIEHFNFKANRAAVYDVIVLSPIADIISKPVKNKKLDTNEELSFSLNTKYWKPGTYRIFIQINGETIQQRKLLIQRNKETR